MKGLSRKQFVLSTCAVLVSISLSVNGQEVFPEDAHAGSGFPDIQANGWEDFFGELAAIVLCASFCQEVKQGIINGDVDLIQTNFDKLTGAGCRAESRMVPASAPNFCPNPPGY